jgi:hypothetical protein
VLNALLQLQKKIERDRSYRPALEAPAGGAPVSTTDRPRLLERGAGEMPPPALAAADERWVEGTKPRVGGPPVAKPVVER